MTKAVSSIFGGGPDTSAQKEQAAALAKQQAAADADKKALQEKQNASLNAARQRKAGARSLVTGLETGVQENGNTTRPVLG